MIILWLVAAVVLIGIGSWYVRRFAWPYFRKRETTYKTGAEDDLVDDIRYGLPLFGLFLVALVVAKHILLLV
jgi:hypothetical protein